MEKDQLTQILELSKRLREYNTIAHDQFVNKTRVEGYEMDFHGEVKPFADKVLEAADQWKPLVMKWVEDDKPLYLHPPQIHDTYDNLTIVSVTAFQKDTRRRRFLETIKSIDYVLDSIETKLSTEVS